LFGNNCIKTSESRSLRSGFALKGQGVKAQGANPVLRAIKNLKALKGRCVLGAFVLFCFVLFYFVSPLILKWLFPNLDLD
jgi:hypothetical protein